jgi:hypothetical protein
VVDLADLKPVAGVLHSLNCQCSEWLQCGSLRGASAFKSMSQLTMLHVDHENFISEEPWGMLAKLTSLQKLHLTVRASGDPSPLSALTGLSSLNLNSRSMQQDEDDRTPFSFSSLQPLIQHIAAAGGVAPGDTYLCCHIPPWIGRTQQIKGACNRFLWGRRVSKLGRN